MAVKIRLKRMGAKKAPFYRIVVSDSRSPRDGRFIEEIGTYNPLKDRCGQGTRRLLDWMRCAAVRHSACAFEKKRSN